MSSPNGTAFLLPGGAQGLASYPHARTLPGNARTIYISGASSRLPDGSVVGCTTTTTTETADGGKQEVHSLDARKQTAAILKNIEAIIRGATDGAVGLEAVVDATVFLTDIKKDYAGMNEEWNKVWPDRTRAPARTCIQVAALPSEKLNVEIKAIALFPEEQR